MLTFFFSSFAEKLVSMLPHIPTKISSVCEVLLDDPGAKIRNFFYSYDHAKQYKLKPDIYYHQENCSNLPDLSFLLIVCLRGSVRSEKFGMYFER